MVNSICSGNSSGIHTEVITADSEEFDVELWPEGAYAVTKKVALYQLGYCANCYAPFQWSVLNQCWEDLEIKPYVSEINIVEE